MINQVEKESGCFLSGVIIRNAKDKTTCVCIENKVKYPIYKKFVTRQIKLLVHDESNVSKNGDRVLIKEVRPYSRKKSWQLVKVLSNVNAE